MWWEMHLWAWHGFHHCSIWAEGSKYQLRINWFSPGKTAVALFMMFNCSSHLIDSSFSMRGEKSQIPSVNWMILWYFYQIQVPKCSSRQFWCRSSSKYNPLLSAPLPKVFPLVPEAISKTNMKHYHIQIHTEITSWGSAATQEFPRAPISKPNLDHVSWICDTFQVNGIRNIYILLMPMKQ